MGISDKFKSIFGIEDEDFEDELMEEATVEEIVPAENTFKADFTQNVVATTPAPVKKERNVSLSSIPRLQVVLVKPERFEEASDIADSLNAKKTVVLNLESASKEVARRLVDFLSGVAYAQDGKIKRVAVNTFIITPYNVGLAGDIVDELESNGLYL